MKCPPHRLRARSLPFLTALLFAGCSQPEEPPFDVALPPAGVVAEATEAIAQPSAPAVSPAAEQDAATHTWRELLEATERSNARLEQRVARLEIELEEARSESRRYRDGVERCVDELNRMAAAAGAPRAAPAPRGREARARVSTLGAPRVQILASGDVLVTGRVWNSGDADARGQIHLELLVDGQTIARASEPLIVGARTDVAYSHRFAIAGMGDGTYSARVTLDY